jgi:hypothetical protein
VFGKNEGGGFVEKEFFKPSTVNRQHFTQTDMGVMTILRLLGIL